MIDINNTQNEIVRGPNTHKDMRVMAALIKLGSVGKGTSRTNGVEKGIVNMAQRPHLACAA